MWSLRAVAAIAAVVVVASLAALWVSMPVAPPPPPPPDGPAVQMNGVWYRMADVNLSHCEFPIGNSTPPETADIDGISFSTRIEMCYSPGGLVLNGSCAPAGGASSFFRLSSRQIPAADGWIWWVSSDGRTAVRWGGAYHAQAPVRAS